MTQEVIDILNYLIDRDLFDYKCFDVLKELLVKNTDFREKIRYGINQNFISKFPRDLFDKVCTQNIRAPFLPVQIFIDGANIGNCTNMSMMISYSLPACDICGGSLSFLRNTKNSPDGCHTWISCNGNVIDPTLMIQVSERYVYQLGYVEENRYNPNLDSIYSSSKDYANDISINRH